MIRFTGKRIRPHILKSILLPNIEQVIDNNNNVSHAQLAEKVEKVFEDATQISKRLDPSTVDSCYPAFIQSGGKYELKPGMNSFACCNAFFSSCGEQ